MVSLKRFTNLILLSLALIPLAACTNNQTPIDTSKIEENTSSVISEVSEITEFIIDDDFSDIDATDIYLAKDLYEVTKQELYEMDVFDIKCFFAKNFGENFRTHFSIPKDYVLTDEDFLNLKAFMYYELFGTFVYTDDDGEHLLLDTSKQVELMNEIFEKQINEPFEMSDAEFIEYLFEKTKNDYCNSPEEEESYMNALKEMSHEELDLLKEKYLQ